MEEVVQVLLDAVDTWYKENVWPAEPPAGMQVQMHPLVYRLLMQHTDLWQYSANFDAWRKRFPVPVKVTPEMPEGAWRLVTVTEEVHIGGKMP